MNNQHQHRRVERQAAAQMRSARLRQRVRNDLSAPPPANAAPYAGERRIGDAFKPLTQRYAYFAQETKAAMVIMLLASIIAVLMPFWLGWTLFSVALTVLALVAALIGAYRWYFHPYGPEVICSARWQAAHVELADAGDAALPPSGLLSTLTLIGIAGVDGFLSGSSLSSGVFANLFTPTMALLAATAWGIGSTYLLYKLAHAAALEANINARRTLIRNLSASRDPDDQARAAHEKGGRRSARSGLRSARQPAVGAHRSGLRRAGDRAEHVRPAADGRRSVAERNAAGRAGAGAVAARLILARPIWHARPRPVVASGRFSCFSCFSCFSRCFFFYFSDGNAPLPRAGFRMIWPVLCAGRHAHDEHFAVRQPPDFA